MKDVRAGPALRLFIPGRVRTRSGGATAYGPDGRPTSGAWTITLPQNIVAVMIASGMATISVDHGKDGTIDRTLTIALPQFQASAG